jgi:hypothetical protein
MLKKFNHDNPNSFNQRFREKRFQFFRAHAEKLKRPLKILDIGGTELYWEMMNFASEKDVSFTICNLDPQEVSRDNFKFIHGDATNLSMFADKEFDIVYSNSVIEHLFTYENQVKMANEIRRVGKNYFVQTPNYYFPIEAHWLIPFFQFMPFAVRVFITQHFSIQGYPKTKNREAAKKRISEVRLLSPREMKRLFPDGKLYREKFMLMTKSISMYKFPLTPQ